MKFIGKYIITLWLLSYYIIQTITINPLTLSNRIMGFSKLMYYVSCLFIIFVLDVFVQLKFCYNKFNNFTIETYFISELFICTRYIVWRFVENWGVNL